MFITLSKKDVCEAIRDYLLEKGVEVPDQGPDRVTIHYHDRVSGDENHLEGFHAQVNLEK